MQLDVQEALQSSFGLRGVVHVREFFQLGVLDYEGRALVEVEIDGTPFTLTAFTTPFGTTFSVHDRDVSALPALKAALGASPAPPSPLDPLR